MWNIEEECKVVPDKDICTDTLAEKKERENRRVHILGPLCKRRDRSLPVFSVLLGAES